MAKFWPSQIFHGIYTMIFSKKTTGVVSISKIKKIYSSVWKISIGQKHSKMAILPKNGQILVLNGQNFAISELSWHIEYDFLKEDYNNNFHTKN